MRGRLLGLRGTAGGVATLAVGVSLQAVLGSDTSRGVFVLLLLVLAMALARHHHHHRHAAVRPGLVTVSGVERPPALVPPGP